MNSVLIWVLSIGLIILGVSTFSNKMKKMKIFISSIMIAYSNLINSQGRNMKCLFKIIIIGIILQIFITVYIKAINKPGEAVGFQVIFFAIILFVFVLGIMYFLFGIPLLIISKMSELINSIKNSKISVKLLISFMIIIIYGFFLWSSKEQMIKYKFIIFSGLAVSYILNIEMLMTVIMNPLCFFANNNQIETTGMEKESILKVTMSGCITLLILIVINLFLGVLMISYVNANAYYCSIPGHKIQIFDLFYYTIISFTTIGYGDIVPNIFPSQLMAVIIAFTSVLCLVIFIGSALSVKDKLKDKFDIESDSISGDLTKDSHLIEYRRLHEQIIQCIRSEKNKLIKKEEVTPVLQNVNYKLLKMNLNSMKDGIDATKSHINPLFVDDLKTHINEVKENVTRVSIDNSVKSDLIKELKNLVEKLDFVQEINLLSEKVTNIANQANILGINASIEAAKAGIDGKTFAIVASEICKFSNNSKKVSSQINELARYTALYIKDIDECIDNIMKLNGNYNKYDIIFEKINKISVDAVNCYKLLDRYNAEFNNISDKIENVVCIVNEQS